MDWPLFHKTQIQVVMPWPSISLSQETWPFVLVIQIPGPVWTHSRSWMSASLTKPGAEMQNWLGMNTWTVSVSTWQFLFCVIDELPNVDF